MMSVKALACSQSGGDHTAVVEQERAGKQHICGRRWLDAAPRCDNDNNEHGELKEACGAVHDVWHKHAGGPAPAVTELAAEESCHIP